MPTELELLKEENAELRAAAEEHSKNIDVASKAGLALVKNNQDLQNQIQIQAEKIAQLDQENNQLRTQNNEIVKVKESEASREQ